MQRLEPDPGPTTVEQQLSGLDLVDLAYEDRPYTVVNFAVTLDGRAAVEGRSGPIGSATDTEMLQLLRTRADAVMIGAGTMRAERYGRIVSDPSLRARRERNGLAHDPLAVIVSGRLDLPWEASLFTDGGGRIVVFTTAAAEPPPTETPLQVVPHDGPAVDLVEAMRYLRQDRGIRGLLCEGGPGLHSELQALGLVDELFVTVAAKLTGGSEPRMIEGELPQQIGWELAWLLEHEGELFARYRRAG
ncbi:MAG: dihydrofolate reductase family protein [Solirubrobacterales bacterium]